MSEQKNTSNQSANNRAVGMAANILFFIVLLFPFTTVNGNVIRSNYRYYIWIVAIATFVLRVLKKETLAFVFSCLSVLVCVIVYTMQWIGIRGASGIVGASCKLNLLTLLFLAVSSILMIRPSLLGNRLG